MDKRLKKQVIAALIIGLIIGSAGSMSMSKVFGGSLRLTKIQYYKVLDERYNKLYQLENMIEKNYYKPVDKKKLYTSMYKGLFKGLNDPYSEYMTKEEYDNMLKESADNYVGTGTVLEKNSNNQIVITEVFDGGPAKAAGIKKGDIILKVDGKIYSGDKVTEASKAMRGKEGTSVKLLIKQETTGETKKFNLVRRVIESTSVYSKIIYGKNEEKIGYIRIAAFHERVARDFRIKSALLKKQGVQGYIIDLRYNGGGYVKEAMEVADELMGKGIICYAEDNIGKREEYKSDANRLDKPYVLLINKYSASASEMIAAGVKDTKSGKIIGSKSFGKGIIQSTLRLPDGDGIKLTIMEYFSPKGKSIHSKGVEPDIKVEAKPDDKTDEVLERAKTVLEGDMESGK